MENKVKKISEFLEQVNQKIELLNSRTSTSLYAFRGEERVYPTSGMPNIFRENMTSISFEKNILDEVVSNGLSQGDNYLHRAIDAQHGGFPSRLLDITFNSVVALFFAVTPHFTKAIDSADKEDSVVIVYAIEEMFSADSTQTQEYYKKQIEGKSSRSDGYNHIFLDHTKRNTRISAQYGGFVMFSGPEFIPIPEFCQEKIIIDGKSKKQLRDELKRVFGLTMGTVYPESDHFVSYLKEKANILSNDIYQVNLEQRLNSFSRELDYHVQTILSDVKVDKEKRCLVSSQRILELELYIAEFAFSYKVEQQNRNKEDVNNLEKWEILDNCLKEIINNCVVRINNYFRRLGLEFDVMSSKDFIIN